MLIPIFIVGETLPAARGGQPHTIRRRIYGDQRW
jgi:hypothetical protein